MTVKGDLAAALVSKGMTWKEARDTLECIFSAASAPDFANRFEKEWDCPADRYWQVLYFLRSTI